jgi:hypothetical protein
MASLVDDGVTGVLVDAGDHDGVADALFELLTCESRRRQMAVAAQARFLENFTADAFRQRFEEAMVRVVKARPLAPALSRRHVLHAGSPGVLRRHGCKREGRQSPVRTAEGPRLGAS